MPVKTLLQVCGCVIPDRSHFEGRLSSVLAEIKKGDDVSPFFIAV